MESRTITEPVTQPSTAAIAETEAVVAYRSVSVLAIVSLLMGLASPLVFAAPLLMAIPVVAAAIAMVALTRIAASEGQLVGRWAALTGLAIAVASVCAVQGYSFAANRLLSRQVRPLAEKWFELLRRGEPASAFQLTSAAERGASPTPPAPGPGPGPNSPSTSLFETFQQSPVVDKLTALGQDAGVEFIRTVACHRLPRGRTIVEQNYRVTDKRSENANTGFVVSLTLQRRPAASPDESTWQVENFQVVD